MYCYKHLKVETPLSCGRCEKPICTKCSVHADVGIRCQECAPHRPRISRKSVPLLGGGVATLIGVVLVGSLLGGVLKRGGSSAPDNYADSEEEYSTFDGVVTVDRLVDPWQGSEEQPAPGRRFVAMEVTLSNPAGAARKVPGGETGFQVVDSEHFVYEPAKSLARPSLPSYLGLDPGQRTRGWIMFEIDAANQVASLNYWNVAVALPR